jgi:hypothetical protein
MYLTIYLRSHDCSAVMNVMFDLYAALKVGLFHLEAAGRRRFADATLFYARANDAGEQ